MKKIILTLLAGFVFFTSSAQIQRKILGFTLGVTPKSTVVQRMKAQGYIHTTDPDGAYIYNNVKFGSVMWSYVSISFYQNKLFQVWFQNNSIQSDYNTLKSQYQTLKITLDEKYGLYFDSEISEGTNLYYSDNITNIMFSLREYRGTNYLSISYEDNVLKTSQKKSERNEL